MRRVPVSAPDPSGLCECDCGQFAGIAKHTDKRAGVVKGGPLHFVHGHENRKNPESRALNVTCRACGTAFHVKRSALGRTKYCSRPCIAVGFRLEEEERFWAKVDKTSSPHGCWLWTGAKHRGYGKAMTAGKIGHAAHRLAYEYMHGPIPPGYQAAHDCPGGDNPSCVRHIKLLTPAEHGEDTKAKGQYPTGMRSGMLKHPESRSMGVQHGMSKLSDDIVRAARLERATGATLISLADKYGVTIACIRFAIIGVTWKHVI
jgi:hypothetical protein